MNALPPRPAKTRTLRLLSALVILPPAVVFAVSGDAPHVLLLTVLGLLGSALLPQPIAISSRSVIYSGVIVASLTVLQHQLLPISAQPFFLLPAHLYTPALLYLAVTLCFFPLREANLAVLMALALLASMLAGNVLSPPLENMRCPFSSWALHNFHLFFAIAASVQLAFLLLLLPRIPVNHNPGKHQRSLAKSLVLLLCLSASVSVILGMRHVGLLLEQRFQQLYEKLFAWIQHPNSETVFSDEVDLWRTVPHLQDQSVVLRLQAQRMPGYLRGYVYTRYQRGRWVGATAEQPMLRVGDGGKYASSWFQHRVAGQVGPAVLLPLPELRIDVYPTARFSTSVLLAPGDARAFELVGSELFTSHDGVLQPGSDWDVQAGWTLLRVNPALASAYSQPRRAASLEHPRYLDVPSELQPTLTSILAQIELEIPAAAATNATTKILAVRNFLHKHYRYALGTRMHGDIDPVEQFLLHNRSGHCELFATAGVLLLRQSGIPARYVTGFVCSESPVANQWTVRLKDAHAWLEVFNRDSGTWQVLECTPAAGIPQSAPPTRLKALSHRLGMALQQLLASAKRGYYAAAIIAVFMLFRQFLQALPGPALFWLLLLGVGSFLVIRRLLREHQQRRKQRQQQQWSGPQAFQRTLTQLQKRLRRHGLERSAEMTLRQWAEQLRRHRGELRDADAVADWLLDYEAMRYRSTVAPAQTAALIARARQLKF